MSVLLKVPTGRAGYQHIVEEVIKQGKYKAPRGVSTLEVPNMTIELANIYDSLPRGVGRNLNPKIAAAEALQLIGGFSDPQLMPEAFERFKEPDGTFWGAYGTRIGYQLNQVYAKLLQDSQTRRAVISLWDPALDNTEDKKDYPCTVALGFSIENFKLNMSTIMRSNDVWLGLPYDMFQFTQLQWTLANALKIMPGTYTHTAWSMHIYESDIEKTFSLHTPTEYDQQPQGIGAFGQYGIASRKMRARILPYVDPSHHNKLSREWTVSEEWYRDQFVTSEVASAQLG